jgi:pyridoxal 5'-phosphate synthase pdxS subunit
MEIFYFLRKARPELIKSIRKVVNIPVMAKVRIGHFVEAQVSTCISQNCVP